MVQQMYIDCVQEERDHRPADRPERAIEPDGSTLVWEYRTDPHAGDLTPHLLLAGAQNDLNSLGH